MPAPLHVEICATLPLEGEEPGRQLWELVQEGSEGQAEGEDHHQAQAHQPDQGQVSDTEGLTARPERVNPLCIISHLLTPFTRT